VFANGCWNRFIAHESARLDIRLDSSLAQRLSDAKLDRILTDGGVALRDDDHLTLEIGTLLGEGINDLIVNVVPSWGCQQVVASRR
jgi:hypothetical protein